MEQKIFHSFDSESITEKARWFQSLTLSERMDIFAEFTDMILSLNPKIVEKKDAQPIEGRILVIRKPSS